MTTVVHNLPSYSHLEERVNKAVNEKKFHDMVEAEEDIEVLLEGRYMTGGLIPGREEKGNGPLIGKPG